jgi:hypothetical protein
LLSTLGASVSSRRRPGDERILLESVDPGRLGARPGEVELLEADVDALHVRVLEEVLVSEVAALVIDPKPGRHSVSTPGDGHADDVVGVDEGVRARTVSEVSVSLSRP